MLRDLKLSLEVNNKKGLHGHGNAKRRLKIFSSEVRIINPDQNILTRLPLSNYQAYTSYLQALH
jgi:hypothetical protein